MAAAAGTRVDFIEKPQYSIKEVEGKFRDYVEFDGKTFETVCAAAVVNAWSYEIDPATGAMFVRIGTKHRFQVLSFSNTLNTLENARAGKNLDEAPRSVPRYHFCVIKFVVNIGGSIDYPQTKLKDSACELWLAHSPEFDFESLFKMAPKMWSIHPVEETYKESMYSSVVWDYKTSRNVAEYCDVYFHDCRLDDLSKLWKARISGTRKKDINDIEQAKAEKDSKFWAELKIIKELDVGEELRKLIQEDGTDVKMSVVEQDFKDFCKTFQSKHRHE